MGDSKNVLAATDSNFAENVLKSDQLTLVDFWAEWCGPCRMLAPTISVIADELAGKVKIFKMNVDENPSTPTQYRIKGIPTILFFKEGKVVDQLVGNQPKDTITQAIERHQ